MPQTDHAETKPRVRKENVYAVFVIVITFQVVYFYDDDDLEVNRLYRTRSKPKGTSEWREEIVSI